MKRTTRLKEPQVPEIGDLINFDELGGRPKYDGVEMTSETNIPSVSAETEARQAADQEIWTEINAIEASSDVVDVVGTYAELEAYDTSKLHDKDLIKVLQDETHDDAITYYRYSSSTETFTYVGAEGPYYTTSETDILLGGKQDKLIAGSNIQIAADGKTISATDTTYSAFTGATSLADGTSGLVPAPTTTDVDKFLKGDGTWGTVSTAANTIFYMNASESGGTRHIYKNPDMTGAATSQEVFDANDQGQVILRISTSATPEMYSDCYLQNAYKATGDYQLLFLDEKTYRSFDTTTLSADTFTYSARVLQDQLTAGTNIQINGKVISATDTTYSAFTGTDGQTAGAAGLVPAPATTDDGKYLNADGSWQAVPTYSTFSGATSQDSGAVGLVPAPMAGEQDKYLKANGLWSTISVSLPIASSVDLGGIKVGTNLSIDGVTGVLSAVDTTYSAFTGATSSVAGAAGLVPAPAAGDDDKYLKGDGTWGTVSSGSPITLFYIDGTLASKGSNYFSIYSDAARTQAVTWSVFGEAVRDGVVRLIFDDTSNYAHYDYDIYLYKDADISYYSVESPTYYVYDGNTRSIRTIEFNGSNGARVTNDLPLSANNISSNDWSALWQ